VRLFTTGCVVVWGGRKVLPLSLFQPPPPSCALFLPSCCSRGFLVSFIPSNIVFSPPLAIHRSIAQGHLPPSQSRNPPLTPRHPPPYNLDLLWFVDDFSLKPDILSSGQPKSSRNSPPSSSAT
jgi:hypothetical protein